MGKDLWGFGYDFRQSNTAHAQDLLRRLRDIRAATGKRVHVVSHSMGCLAVRSLLINHPKEFEELVRRGVGWRGWADCCHPRHARANSSSSLPSNSLLPPFSTPSSLENPNRWRPGWQRAPHSAARPGLAPTRW